MKIQVLGAIAVSAGLLSAQATLAQSTVTSAAGSTNAPAASVTMAPGINAGVRTAIENAGDGFNNEAGGYITPNFDLAYKGSQINFGLNYELEMFTGRGFGKAKDAAGLGKNSYFINHPVVTAAFKISPNWTLKNVNDMAFKIFNQADQKLIEIASITELERKISPRLSVSAGYRLDYVSAFGSDLPANKGTEDLLDNNVKASVLASQPVTPNDSVRAFKAANPNYGDNPMAVGHSGLVRTVVGITNDVKLNTYVFAGTVQDYKGTNTTTYRYRMNNDLIVSAIKNVDLMLRYRIQWANPEGTKNGKLRNHGLVDFAYNLNNNWAVKASNEFVHHKNFDGKNDYSNETYVGAAYKF